MGSVNSTIQGILIITAVSFAVTVLLGRLLLPLLRRLKAGQSIKEIGPTCGKLDLRRGCRLFGGGQESGRLICVPLCSGVWDHRFY